MEWENVVAGQRADPAQINKIGNQVAKYKGLRLARRIVLTELVSVIEFNADSDGNALNSTLGGELRIKVSGSSVATGTTAYILAQFNKIYTDNYVDNIITPTKNYMCVSGIKNINVNCISEINILNNTIFAFSRGWYRDSSGGSLGNIAGELDSIQNSITSIKLFLSAGTFPAGTVAEWWERG